VEVLLALLKMTLPRLGVKVPELVKSSEIVRGLEVFDDAEYMPFARIVRCLVLTALSLVLT